MSYRYEYRHEFLKPKPERNHTPTPYTIPEPRPAHPDEIALLAAFTRQGLAHPHVFHADACLVAVHLFGLRHLAPHVIPYTPEPTPFTPSTPKGWDARRSHDTTQRAITVIDPQGVKYADRGAAAIRILETLRETLGIEIPGWPDVTQP